MVDRVVQGSKYILGAYAYRGGEVVVALRDAGGWSGDYVDVRVESDGEVIENVHLSDLQ